MTHAVFLSYSRSDSEWAKRLKHQIDLRGISVWLDEDAIGKGTRWDTEVQTAILNCKYFVVLLSPRSVLSDSVQDEIHFALEKRKSIVPFLIENCEKPLRLSRIQHIDLARGDQFAISQLIERLSSGLETEDTTPLSSPGQSYTSPRALQTPSGKAASFVQPNQASRLSAPRPLLKGASDAAASGPSTAGTDETARRPSIKALPDAVDGRKNTKASPLKSIIVQTVAFLGSPGLWFDIEFKNRNLKQKTSAVALLMLAILLAAFALLKLDRFPSVGGIAILGSFIAFSAAIALWRGGEE